MTSAAAAAEYQGNIGHDYDLAFELAEWEAEQEAEADEAAERQALNARVAEWYGIG
jgi:hypothetical protein